MSETKSMYTMVYGVAPFLQSLLAKQIRDSREYVLLFDETLNVELQKKQMDILVRGWFGGEVSSRYYKSVFFGHGTAVDLEEVLHSHVEDSLGYSGMLQLSMDGPAVNWALFNKLQETMIEEHNTRLIDIGSCGLHTLHNRFRDGAESTGWDIGSTLGALYRLFKDTPARREDYTAVTGSSDFPLRFCSHRWVENVGVARRAKAIMGNVKKYVQAVRSKKVKDPKTKSFEIISQWVQDPLADAKLSFFVFVALPIETFLRNYQTDQPLIAHLAVDLTQTMHTLMSRFVKAEIIDDATNDPYKLMKVDITKNENLKSYKDLDIGFETDADVKSSKASDRAKFEFRQECRTFLVTIVSKFREKCPISYSLVRNLSCLDPTEITRDKSGCDRKFKKVLKLLADAHRVQLSQCDSLLEEFTRFTNAAQKMDEFRNYQKFENRLDALYYNAVSSDKSYKKLWPVLRQLLLLSHGQATVERSFSINKNVTTQNLSENALNARRIIVDHIRHVGGIQGMVITKELLQSVQHSRHRYEDHLEENRRNSARSAAEQKRKLAEEEVLHLKKRIKTLHNDKQSLLQQADEMCIQAEDERSLDLIVHANALRKHAAHKDKEAAQLGHELADKEKKLTVMH